MCIFAIESAYLKTMNNLLEKYIYISDTSLCTAKCKIRKQTKCQRTNYYSIFISISIGVYGKLFLEIIMTLEYIYMFTVLTHKFETNQFGKEIFFCWPQFTPSKFYHNNSLFIQTNNTHICHFSVRLLIIYVSQKHSFMIYN